MPRFAVILEETARYTVPVEAVDRDAAPELAEARFIAEGCARFRCEVADRGAAEVRLARRDDEAPPADRPLVAVIVRDGGLSGRRWAGYVVTRAVRADGRLWSLPSLPEHVKAATRISGGRVLYGRKAEAMRAAAAYGEVLPGFYREAGNGHPCGLIVPATVDAMGKPLQAAA